MRHLLNDQIDAIWEGLSVGNPNLLLPLYLESLEEKDLLFVGMNPSFSKGAMEKWFKKNGWNVHPEEYYLWSNKHAFCAEREALTRAHSRASYPFFRQHHNLISHLDSPSWCHLDLFPYRETQQTILKELCAANPAFSDACLTVFDKALREISPKMIVIWNKGAADIFFERYEREFNRDVGTYHVNIADRRIPVFASSMVTGRRALDTYSRERLFWHINKAFSSLDRPRPIG